MGTFLDTIEADIATIHTSNGVDNATVVKEISDAVTAGVAPIQAQITDLQTALTDVVAKLKSGDTTGALATAEAATPPAPATDGAST